MRISLVGFGQIGGSIARALRRPGADLGGEEPPEIVAWSPTGRGPMLALETDIVDEVAASLPAAIADADLVVLAAPPFACLALVDELGGPLRDVLAPGAVVTDVASTKATIVARAAERGLPFVGGHPMAGRELAGYGAAADDLFVDRPWVLVGAAGRLDDAARVEWLARACGARPLIMEAGVHDEAVAAISHLPLVSSVALVEAVTGALAGDGGGAGSWQTAAPLAAGGWASATRLAMGDPTMGAGILATNAAPVARRIRDLQAALDSWLAELEAPDGPDPAALERRLRSARDRMG